jgi:DNA-binding transcriptional regulator YhcF (GntR family)
MYRNPGKERNKPIILDKKSPIPVYFQLKMLIQKKIRSGEYDDAGTA